MSNSNRYDPEDLELLLHSKTFSELLPEEKAFVLQHLENDAEYDSMRETLLNLESLKELEPAIIPRISTKNTLMAAFESSQASKTSSEEKEPSKLTAWWLWFWNTNKFMFFRPAFQLASLVLIVSLVTYVTTFNVENKMAQVQEVSEKEVKKKSSNNSAKPNKSDSKTTEERNENSKSVTKEKSETLTKVVSEPAQTVPTDLETTEELEDLKSFKNTEGKDIEAELNVSDEPENLFDKELIVEDVDDALEETKHSTFSDELSENETSQTSTLSATPNASNNYTSHSTEIIYDGYNGDSSLDVERATLGNSDFSSASKLKKVTVSSDFNVSVDSKPALLASDFSNLLSKLHTAE